jgi:hypothetical protein
MEIFENATLCLLAYPTQWFYLAPPRLCPTMTEAQLQSKAFTNFWNNNPHLRGRLFAINQNSHNQIKGAINRSLGVLPGVSDMAYLIPGSVVWIEWKTPSGKQSPDQRKFQELVTSLNMHYHIVTSEEDFLKIIALYAN